MANKAKALQQQPGKVLRIGLFQAGKPVHERLIKPGQSVTIGESPKNTFVFPARGLPKRFTLFQARGSTYTLNFTEGMKGKLAHKGGVAQLDKLRASGEAVRKGAGWSIKLSPQDRGKIEVDQVTVLFQFVSAPPESARLVASRQDFRPRLIDDDDPVFLGFLALWTAVAALLMVYVFNTEPPELVPLEQIPDRFVEVVIPPKDQKPKEDLPPIQDENAQGKQVAKEEQQQEQKAGKKAAEKKPMTAEEKAVAEAKRIEAKRQEVLKKSKLLAGIIGTRGESASDQTVEDVFAEGDGNFQNLQEALQNVGGVEVASEDAVAMRGPSEGGGRADASIGDLAKSGGGSAKVGNVAAKAPTGKASLGAMEVASGEAADKVRATINKYRAQIKYCYEQRLKERPDISGRIAVDVDVSAGRVTSVVVSDNTTGDSALESCVKSKIRRWRFPSDFSDSIYLPFALSPS